MQFEEGSTYTCKDFPEDILVLAVAGESSDAIQLAILWVNRGTKNTTNSDELNIKKSDLNKWSKVDL
jgi:hypothetical protein